MNREIVFGQALEAVRKRAKEQGNVISQQEVEQAFEALSLAPDQLEMVYDYLKKHGVGIDEAANIEDYLDDTDRDYLEWYLRELAALEELGEGEREAVTLSAMAGDADAKKRLMTAYLPQVVDLAKLYAGQGVIMEDLIGEGNVALAMGMEMLGALENASQAQGMLGRLMMDAMEECIACSVQSGDIGRKAAEQVNKVADAAKELSDALLRKVTPQELAVESGIALEEIQEAMRLAARKIEEIEDTDGSGKP